MESRILYAHADGGCLRQAERGVTGYGGARDLSKQLWVAWLFFFFQSVIKVFENWFPLLVQNSVTIQKSV